MYIKNLLSNLSEQRGPGHYINIYRNMNIMSSNTHLSHYDKEVLIRRISAIKNKQCYLDILELIHSHGLDYTVNSNGVYLTSQ